MAYADYLHCDLCSDGSKLIYHPEGTVQPCLVICDKCAVAIASKLPELKDSIDSALNEFGKCEKCGKYLKSWEDGICYNCKNEVK